MRTRYVVRDSWRKLDAPTVDTTDIGAATTALIAQHPELVRAIVYAALAQAGHSGEYPYVSAGDMVLMVTRA